MRKIAMYLSFLMLLSCDGGSYTSAHVHNIEDDVWEVQDTIAHKVLIQDTSRLYQLSLLVSSTINETNEIDILSNICFNNICTKTDTIKIHLSNKLPRTLIAKERKCRFLVMDSIKFASVGEYEFKFFPSESAEISTLGVYIYEKKDN